MGEWKELKARIHADFNNVEIWKEAYNHFLTERIDKRYSAPIRAINGISEHLGKGFSIVTICCSLIEFFQSLKMGNDFNHPHYFDKTNTMVRSSRNRDGNGNYQPLSNKDVFIDFLTTTVPFNGSFTEKLSEDFYTKVRCGILHQAETKGNWIVADGKLEDHMITVNDQLDEKQLNRIPFKKGFNAFLETYEDELLNSDDIKNSFVFKFDKICQIN